jgi:dTDP-4-amino-4,6-dideoxygalactose transaminase
VRSPERDRIREHLAASEIASTAYYETPLHLQPALRSLGHSEGEFPETERASRENLALPLWAGIGADVQERVVSAVREAVSLEAVR